MARPRDGLVQFVLQHRTPDWALDHRRYEFPERDYSDFSVLAIKNADRTLDLMFHVGVLNGRFSFHTPIPPNAASTHAGVEVLLSWHQDILKLYVNQHLVHSRRI